MECIAEVLHFCYHKINRNKLTVIRILQNITKTETVIFLKVHKSIYGHMYL